ncbi:hypothetical protein R6Z07F_003400 [Ovis aries]
MSPDAQDLVAPEDSRIDLPVPDTEVTENTSLLLEPCFRIRPVASKAIFICVDLQSWERKRQMKTRGRFQVETGFVFGDAATWHINDQ